MSSALLIVTSGSFAPRIIAGLAGKSAAAGQRYALPYNVTGALVKTSPGAVDDASHYPRKITFNLDPAIIGPSKQLVRNFTNKPGTIIIKAVMETDSFPRCSRLVYE